MSNIPKNNFSFLTKSGSGIFSNNFSLEKVSNDIPTYNDIDYSFSTEIFKSIDMDNVSTIPYLYGRFSRLFLLTEDFNHNIAMYLIHEVGLGMGLSIIALQLILRALFFKQNIKNHKNMTIQKLIFPEKNEMNQKIKMINNHIHKNIELKKMRMVEESLGVKYSSIGNFISLFQLFLTMTNACLIQRYIFHVYDYPEALSGGFLWFKDLSIVDPYLILPLVNLILQISSIYYNKHVYSSNLMLSLRRILFIVPFCSLPIMLSFESGLLLYFCCATGNFLLFNYISGTNYIRKMYKIPSSIDHSLLEKMNPKNKGEITNLRKLESSILNVELNSQKDLNQKLFESKFKYISKKNN